MDRNFSYGAVVLALAIAAAYLLNTAIWLFNQPNDIALLLGFTLTYLTTWASLKIFVRIYRKWKNNE